MQNKKRNRHDCDDVEHGRLALAAEDGALAACLQPVNTWHTGGQGIDRGSWREDASLFMRPAAARNAAAQEGAIVRFKRAKRKADCQ